jgi:hypothetical protein
VEEEISKARAYFADDQPEADDDETPVNSIP